MTPDRQRTSAYASLSGLWKQESVMIKENLKGLRDLVTEYPDRCDRHLLRAEASYIHDFYNSVENLFKAVAEELNGGVPRGNSWHKLLLLEMRNPLPGMREAVVSDSLHDRLDVVMKFRHLFRNSYGVLLDPVKTRTISRLVLGIEQEFASEFQRFLDTLGPR